MRLCIDKSQSPIVASMECRSSGRVIHSAFTGICCTNLSAARYGSLMGALVATKDYNVDPIVNWVFLNVPQFYEALDNNGRFRAAHELGTDFVLVSYFTNLPEGIRLVRVTCS